MKKYSIPIIAIVIGGLFFLLGSLIGSHTIQGVNFAFGELFTDISATFISVATLAFTYEMLGGEAVINLIEYLIKLQRVAQNIEKMGIEELVDARRRFEYEKIHENLRNGKEMFIASRTFDSIKYSDVKNLFKSHLEKKGNVLKILLDKNSDNISKLVEFRKTLLPKQHERFEIRLSEHISCGIYGSDYKIYVTPYLNTLRGEETPSLLCNNRGKNSIYPIYKEEFYDTWKKSIPV
jgi:hypothetical protein